MDELVRVAHVDEVGEQGLKPGEVIDRAYQKLVEKYGVEDGKIEFEEPLSVTVVSDVYGNFSDAELIEINGNRWLVSQVKPLRWCYPPGRDITAIRVGDSTTDKGRLQERFKSSLKGPFLQRAYSVIYEEYGKLNTSPLLFEAMGEYLKNVDFDGYVLNVKYDHSYGFPPEKKYEYPIRFKPEIVYVLVEGIERVLGA